MIQYHSLLECLFYMNIIRMENVGVDFDGKWPLKNVDFSFDYGDFVILNGPNGSGKTTLLRLMLRLLAPTEGKVVYLNPEGHPVKHLSIGYLPQKNNIDTRFPITVGEAVQSGVRRGWLSRLTHSDKQRLEEVVDLCGIRDYLSRPIGTLSGGQLQRALLARALAADPTLLVLDEPLSYVDKSFEARLYELLSEEAKRRTIILVSHELSGLAPLATKIVELPFKK